MLYVFQLQLRNTINSDEIWLLSTSKTKIKLHKSMKISLIAFIKLANICKQNGDNAKDVIVLRSMNEALKRLEFSWSKFCERTQLARKFSFLERALEVDLYRIVILRLPLRTSFTVRISLSKFQCSLKCQWNEIFHLDFCSVLYTFRYAKSLELIGVMTIFQALRGQVRLEFYCTNRALYKLYYVKLGTIFDDSIRY